MQYNRFWTHIVQFAILQPPQNVLRSVGAYAKVKAVHRYEMLVPIVGKLQRLEYAVTNKHHVRVLLLAFRNESFVDAQPSVITVQIFANGRQRCRTHSEYVLLSFASLAGCFSEKIGTLYHQLGLGFRTPPKEQNGFHGCSTQADKQTENLNTNNRITMPRLRNYEEVQTIITRRTNFSLLSADLRIFRRANNQ
uniref:Uncharacterized protein n=1 Tax=Anopheles funestus TaxID=62324 RepID=A0A182S2F5_ANOFN